MRPWFGVLREGREVVILGGRSAKAVRPFFLLLLDLAGIRGAPPRLLRDRSADGAAFRAKIIAGKGEM